MTDISSWLPEGIAAPDMMILLLVALLIGMAKTGVHGAGMMSVPLLAAVFGGQQSSGMMLPMLLLADFLGVWYYHRHASWVHLRMLFPWAAVGVLAGTWAGTLIDEVTFRQTMAWIIFISLGVMVWMELGSIRVPGSRIFSSATGILGGFTSMIGNLANSVTAVYFLSVRLPKEIFIGTTAWFFLVVNAFKVPFHVFFWETISAKTMFVALLMFPAIVAGAIAGIWVVRRFSEKQYRWFIILMTAIAAAGMLVRG